MIIMGFDFMFMSIKLVEDVGYILKGINWWCFPITKASIKEKGIENLIICINAVKIN